MEDDLGNNLEFARFIEDIEKLMEEYNYALQDLLNAERIIRDRINKKKSNDKEKDLSEKAKYNRFIRAIEQMLEDDNYTVQDLLNAASIIRKRINIKKINEIKEGLKGKNFKDSLILLDHYVKMGVITPTEADELMEKTKNTKPSMQEAKDTEPYL